MTRLLDLSHTVEHGMVTYKGLPAPLICDYLTREASVGQRHALPSECPVPSGQRMAPHHGSRALAAVEE